MAPPQLLHLIREERRAWTLAKAVPVVMMLALRETPWGQPWNPARDIGPKVLVLRAKCLLERWFFVHQDEDVEKEPEQRGIPEEAPIAKQHSLTEDDCDDGDVDRISHMPVETCDHQVLGWRNGRRCAESLKRKSRKGVHEAGQTDQDQEDADRASDLKTQECRPQFPA